jgi:hypothetical protein
MNQGELKTRPLGQRVAEAGSTRWSEFEDMSDAERVALTWSDVLARDNGQVQLKSWVASCARSCRRRL